MVAGWVQFYSNTKLLINSKKKIIYKKSEIQIKYVCIYIEFGRKMFKI